jgi:hypothetical protein
MANSTASQFKRLAHIMLACGAVVYPLAMYFGLKSFSPDQRIIKQPIVGKPHNQWNGVDLQRRQLLHSKRDIQITVGIIRIP